MKQSLKTLISELESNTLCIISGGLEKLRNGDVYYPFRQDSDFLYLTGLSVPGLVLTIYKKSEQTPLNSPLSGGLGTTETTGNPQSLSRQLLSKGAFTEIILWRESLTEKDMIW